ncbi:MAG: hypothetical protein AAFR96_02350 [Planctomycetota bacterium]
MQRPGADPNDMQLSDFLCDFSGKPWDGAFPLVEGHQGSLISGDCLAVAFRQVVHERETSLPPGSYTCTMCLEQRQDPCWQSPVREEAVICRRCIKQSAARLNKDPDWDWKTPTPTPTTTPTPIPDDAG